MIGTAMANLNAHQGRIKKILFEGKELKVRKDKK